VSERRKANAYRGFYGHSWFWRTHTGAELDYVEDCDGELAGFEFKLRPREVSLPQAGQAPIPKLPLPQSTPTTIWTS